MKQDKFIAIILLLILGPAYYMTYSFPPRSAVFPRAFIAITAILAVVLLVQALYKEKKNMPQKVGEAAQYTPSQRYRLFVSVIVTILYMVIIPKLGYFVATAIYMFVLMTLLKKGKMLTHVIVTVGTTLVLYGVFGVLLKIWLPRGILL